jgi:two-component system chemotaxis response regulator CheY
MELLAQRDGSQFDADKPLRLLLAEDEPMQRRVIARTLTDAGYQVDQARDGHEALSHLRGGDFAMLVTDWDMPGLDGPGLCREIRSGSFSDYIYILILTGHDSGADVVSGLEAGADDYVRKSAPPDELLARFSAGARIIRLERSLRAAQRRIQALSVTDPLLPIYNRRYLGTELEKEVARCVRYARALSVIVADLDHFKSINDQHGHLVGDEVLRAFTELLSVHLRATDWAARYGGEEFVIVLPETELSAAMVVAEKLRDAFAAATVPTSHGDVKLTASFGVASLRAQRAAAGSVIDALLGAADAALYRSKSAGRNRVAAAASL